MVTGMIINVLVTVICAAVVTVCAVDPKMNSKPCDPATMFTCSLGINECVPKDRTCNGISECANGEDESVAICGCLPNEFQCNMTSCIDAIKRCDTELDCQGGEDEQDCEKYTCPDTHTKCKNHYCVPNDAACDHNNDCGDNSDEEICEYRQCYSTEFRCNDSKCIPIGFLCDGTMHCNDGSDESDCDKHFQCNNGLYIHMDKKCDGWVDCYESHVDETVCGNCTADQFRCNNGRCIRNSNVCDGECDCFYTCEDELDCGSIECKKGEKYICKNSNRCIKSEYLCDGSNDCWNTYSGADEYFCPNTSNGIPPSECEFQCPEGRCFPASGGNSVRCDHHADCLNGEDEEGCEYEHCKSVEFDCGNGQCIPWEKRCDGRIDCYNRSDEVGCASHSCPPDTKKCKSGQCIPKHQWCDFYKDCSDFSDETNCERRRCESHEFQCNNGQCIDNKLICYKQKDSVRSGCADGSHLLDCRNFTCGPDQFKCTISYCINLRDKCDGELDCKMTYADELECEFPCPNPEMTCTCLNIEMNCEKRGLIRLPNGLSNEDLSKFKFGGNLLNITKATFEKHSKLTHLDLHNNSIHHLPDESFRKLWRLTTLNLEHNHITYISNGTFLGLTNLRTLYLGDNMLSRIDPRGFIGLSHLHALNLSYQNIHRLESNTFIGLRNVRMLDLSHNRITYVSDGAFSGLVNLLTLDLSNNKIRMIHTNVFHGLSLLEYLDVSSNEIDIMEEHVFDGLHNLHHLITDEFRFCCAAQITGRCLPEPDEFSSCTDLMSNYVLRISIWILGLVGFWGNIIVVVWRTRDLRNGKVHSFLITNLAIGDFFMGVYLMIIAVVDSYYRGKYILYDKVWRESDLCKFAGFISTFSSELSVLTLTVITIDRLIAIIFPLTLRRLKLRDAFYVMIFIWLLVIAISSFPLIGLDYFDNFYGRSGVCLAFHITNDKPKGWEYSVAVFLVLNFVSFIVIFLSYLRMFFVAKKTRSAVRKTQDKNDSAMAKRMTLIVMTDFFCWVPIILLGFASLGGANIPPQVYAWVAVFILPLNSAVNPVLYTLCTAPFLRNFRKRASFFRKSFTASKNDTKHTFLDDRNSSHMWDRKPIYRHLELMRMRSFNNKSFSTSQSPSSHSENLM